MVHINIACLINVNCFYCCFFCVLQTVFADRVYQFLSQHGTREVDQNALLQVKTTLLRGTDEEKLKLIVEMFSKNGSPKMNL